MFSVIRIVAVVGWLRHYTSRKVDCLIPGGAIELFGIFHCLNPSGRTIAVESTQPLTEMSIRDLVWGVKAAGT